MITIKDFLRSTVGRKFLIAATGLAMSVFLVTHLAGNILLYFPEGTAFNEYANRLQKLGPLLVIAEVGLFFAFLLHVVLVISQKALSKQARPERYTNLKPKEAEVHSTVFSKSMLVSGIALLIFIPLHILHFTKGPSVNEGYVTMVGSEDARDVYRLVVEEFSKPVVVVLYTIAMVLLFSHLRHGIWSAIQSFGTQSRRTRAKWVLFALIFALVIGGGFFGIPVYLYLKSGVLS